MSIRKTCSLHPEVSREVDHLLANGSIRVTLKVLSATLSTLGYRFNRELDCKGVSVWKTGPRAGESYPSMNLYTVQISDGKSAFDVDSRRDSNYQALQVLRDRFFAATRNYVVQF